METDRTLIHPDSYHLYANTNEAFLTMPLRGIVLEFPGLGGGSCLGGCMEMHPYDSEWARDFGKHGILHAYLFPGPWSWGNAGAVRIADAVIDALLEKYGVPVLPIGVCGGSMGGLGALIFAADSRHALCAVAAACPCTDVPVSFACRDDIPRTFISAVACYDMPLEQALCRISPVHRIQDMPHVSYYICSDGNDVLFPEELCNTYAQQLRDAGHTVEYDRQPGLGHGDFTPAVRQKLHDSLKSAILHA